MAARSDAARNRERLLEVARAALERESAPSLEAIARAAGVGIATLYRHFPTRDALAEGVYREELEALASAADELLEQLPPDEALLAWGERFADRIESKRRMADAVRGLISSGAVTTQESRATLAGAAQRILDAGVADGSLRAGASGEDLVIALVGVYLACPDQAQNARARRALRLVVQGITRPLARGSAG